MAFCGLRDIRDVDRRIVVPSSLPPEWFGVR